MRALLAVVVLLAGCITNAFSNAAASKQIQKRDLRKAMPAELGVEIPVPGDARTARVRVWVDEDFRAQHLRWRSHVEEQLDEANQFLVPALGLRLEPKAIEPWNVRSADRSLEDVLGALETHDPGDDVDWVIAYVSSLALVEASMEGLGVARPLGRHLVMRGYADVAERKAFEAAFPETSGDERERVHQARRRHKQTAILLHELAHTLAAPHELDGGWLMHAVYDPGMSTFSQQSRELMGVTLQTWLVPRASFDVRAVAAKLQTFFEANPWGGWVEDERVATTTYLRALVDASGGPPAANALTVPAEAYDQYRRALGLAQAGKLADARAELDALVAAYPATPDIRQAICDVQVATDGPASPASVKACDRAAEIAPTDPRPLVTRIAAHLRAGESAAALPLLARLEARADRADVWLQIAAIYQAQTLVTRAEAAAARAHAITAGSGDDVTAWARRTRARYGLPPDARAWRIGADDEGAYVTAVRGILDSIYANQLPTAKKAAAAASKRWPGAPGLLAARCDLALRDNQLGAARKLCDQAIAAWPGAAWALYLRGILLLQSNKAAPAIASLRAAIAAEPELAQAYRTLGKAYDRTGDTAAKDALAADYAARFNARLP